MAMEPAHIRTALSRVATLGTSLDDDAAALQHALQDIRLLGASNPPLIAELMSLRDEAMGRFMVKAIRRSQTLLP